MLHSTKRALLRPLHLSAPLDEDVAAWQQKLSNVSAALAAASASLAAQRRDWARLFTTADTFASDLHTLYPNDDDVRALGKRSRTATAGLLAARRPRRRCARRLLPRRRPPRTGRSRRTCQRSTR